MKFLSVIIAVLVGVCTGGAAPVGQEHLQQLHGINHVVSDWAASFARLDVETVRRSVGEFEGLPLYMRLASAPFIIDAIDDPETVDSPDYERTLGTHDLRRIGGRAAYYLECAFPIELPTVTPTSSDAELEHIQQSAQRQFEAYRAGVMEMVEIYEIGADIQELNRRYQRLIFQGVEVPRHGFWNEGAPHFEQMLLEFFPLGKSLTDLESIMGSHAYALDPELRDRDSSAGVTGVFKYSYHDHSMMFGESYFFLVEDGIITAMNVAPIS